MDQDMGSGAMVMPGHDLGAGWGVLRMRPWRLAGVFVTSVEAEALARALGADYVVKYGDHRVGSGEFSFEQTAIG
jgi:hypothetical protein